MTPVNSGNGLRSWLRATVAPLMVVPGSRPAKGFGTCAIQVVRVAPFGRVAQRQVGSDRAN